MRAFAVLPDRAARLLWPLVIVFAPAVLSAQGHPPPPLPMGVDVEPKNGGPVIVAAGADSAVVFTVTNLRTVTTSYSLTCSTSGQIDSCIATPDALDLAPNETENVTVAFSADAIPGAGVVSLIASGVASDSGNYNVTVVAPVSPTLAQPRQPDSVINHAHCLTSTAGIADWSCGDAIFQLSTPSYTTLDRARAMTLVYSSATAAPEPLVSVNVTLDTTQPPLDRVRAVLTVNDTVRTTAAYTAWSDATRQLVLGWSAGAAPTGAYPYTLTVYTVAGGDSASSSVSGLVYVVNRTTSPYGDGWEWLGVERLVFNQPVGSGNHHILWVDGDGSAKLYRQVDATHWVAPPEEYRDTITLASGTYTRLLPHGVAVTFDSAGRHVSTTNRQTQVTHFYWHSATALDSVRVPPAGSGGKTFAMLYDGSGFLDSVLVGGRNIGLTVTGGFLTGWRWPDSTSTTFLAFHVDAGGRIDSTIDARGGATRLHYGLYGLVDTAKVWYDSASSHIAALTKFTPWQSAGYAGTTPADTDRAITSIVGPRGVGDSAEFHVDKWGAPIAVKDPDHQTTRYVRGDDTVPAEITEIDFPNARKAFMTYDGLANLLTLTDSSWGGNAFPLQKTRWAYHDSNDLFSPDSVIAPDGTLTRYAYTSLGLTDSMIDPRSHVTRFTYAASDDSVRGQVLSVTERAVPTWIQSMAADRDTDLVTTLGYDASGNSVKAQNPAGAITKYTRNGTSGLVTQIDNAIGLRQQVAYDLLDHVVRRVVVHAGGDSTNACLSNEFICSSLIVGALNPSGTADTTTATYVHGVLAHVRDPRGVPHSYGYDLRGLLVADSDEAGHPDLATYDRGGLVTAQTTRVSETMNFAYDAAGRQTRWTIPARTMAVVGSAATSPGDTIASTYDSLGNLTVHKSGQGTITRTYYENGAILQEFATDTGSTPEGDTLSYAYQTSGHLAALRWPRGDTARYGYNATTGDLDSVTATWTDHNGTQSRQFLIRTDVAGRRRGISYPYASLADTFHYDRLGVLRWLRSVNTAAPTTNRFDFTLKRDSVDLLGRILHQRVTCDSMMADSTTFGAPCGSWTPSETDTRYNRLGALVEQWTTQFPTSGVARDTFKYDVSGNRIAATYDFVPGHTTTFTYGGSSNRLSTSSDSSWVTHGNVGSGYTYDLAGSRIKDTLGDQQVQGYQYDGAGRAKGNTLVTPSTFMPGHNDTLPDPNTCGYNADGLLVRGCGVARVSYFGSTVVREHNLDWWFVPVPGLDDPIVVIKRGFSGVANVTQAWLPIISDGQGQLLAIADSAGQLQDVTVNAALQTGVWNSGLTIAAQSFNPRRWVTPGSIDTISTFRARQYDPGTGKWLQEDPAGLAGGVNLYEYNGNDPNSFSDPFGLAMCPPHCDALQAVSGLAFGALGEVAGGAGGAAAGTVTVPVVGTIGLGAAGGAAGAAVGAGFGIAAASASEVVVGAAANAMGKLSRLLGHILIGVIGVHTPQGIDPTDATTTGAAGRPELVVPPVVFPQPAADDSTRRSTKRPEGRDGGLR